MARSDFSKLVFSPPLPEFDDLGMLDKVICGIFSIPGRMMLAMIECATIIENKTSMQRKAD